MDGMWHSHADTEDFSLLRKPEPARTVFTLVACTCISDPLRSFRLAPRGDLEERGRGWGKIGPGSRWTLRYHFATRKKANVSTTEMGVKHFKSC